MSIVPPLESLYVVYWKRLPSLIYTPYPGPSPDVDYSTRSHCYMQHTITELPGGRSATPRTLLKEIGEICSFPPAEVRCWGAQYLHQARQNTTVHIPLCPGLNSAKQATCMPCLDCPTVGAAAGQGRGLLPVTTCRPSRRVRRGSHAEAHPNRTRSLADASTTTQQE
jgi:hypothetical protein